jgi:hypothetical protein
MTYDARYLSTAVVESNMTGPEVEDAAARVTMCMCEPPAVSHLITFGMEQQPRMQLLLPRPGFQRLKCQLLV